MLRRRSGGSPTAFPIRENAVPDRTQTQSTAPFDQTPLPAIPPVATKRGRVLVVEDQNDAAASLVTLLDLHGFTPLSVAAGTAAVAAINVLEPDAVLLDLGLPGVDGEEVAKRVLTLPTDLRPRVVVLTARDDAAARDRLLGLGVEAYLVKPAEPAVLIACVRKATQAN